jgi:PAS domain S-box-containing protein
VTTFRRALVDCLRCESESEFEEQAATLVDEYDLGDVAATSEPPSAATTDLDARDGELRDRIRRFDTGPLGLTLSGPAYRDNPILYANRTLRDLTGYSLGELRGENPRLFQGSDTEPDALERLHEAIDIWSEATVELRNYRRDGTPFRNRLTVVPVPDHSGTIANWIGIQAAVNE